MSPTAVFVVIVPLVYYVTHASLRYRHPIDPIVLMLTAIAVTGVRQAKMIASGEASGEWHG